MKFVPARTNVRSHGLWTSEQPAVPFWKGVPPPLRDPWIQALCPPLSLLLPSSRLGNLASHNPRRVSAPWH